MKTFWVVIVTVFFTGFTFNLVHSLHKATERLWLISNIKVPGDKAIADIQNDMKDGRITLATAKLQVFKQTWDRFNQGPDSFSGQGIGDILLTFSKLDDANTTNSPERH